MIVACLVPVLGVGGCFGSRFESEGMHGMATRVRVEDSIGIAFLVTGGVFFSKALEAEGMAALLEVARACIPTAIGWSLVDHAEGRYEEHVRRLEALEGIELLRAEYPEVSERLGPPERLQKAGSGALMRLETVERLRVEEPERFRRLRKELIAGWACVGGGMLTLAILVSTSSEQEDPSFWQWAVAGATVGAVITGLTMFLHYQYSMSGLGRPRSARFLLAPNGCAVSYRF